MASTKTLRFRVGDWVVHYSHGVGKVVEIVNKRLEGEDVTFFKIKATNIEYWLPVDLANADHIEPIRSEKDFEKALDVIKQAPTPMTLPHNQTKRQIYERWLDGSLCSRASLMRDLQGRDHLKVLNYDEKELLAKIEEFFIHEWTIINPSLTKQKARQFLDHAYGISERKMNQPKNLTKNEQSLQTPG